MEGEVELNNINEYKYEKKKKIKDNHATIFKMAAETLKGKPKLQMRSCRQSRETIRRRWRAPS